MPTLHLKNIFCHSTQEARDEVYLMLRPCVGAAARLAFGPRSIDDGESVEVDLRYEIGDCISVEMREDDGKYGDDHCGFITVGPSTSVGAHSADFYNYVGASCGHYTLHYAVEDDHDERPAYLLELVELSCVDPQEAKDEPYLVVDGLPLWGPGKMDRGDSVSLYVKRTIRDICRVSLWEHDGAVSDHIGTLRIPPTQTDESTHTFDRDEGIVGSARYELRYRVTRVS